MFVAKVKNVISGDQIILVPSKATAIPPPERLLTLQNIRADSYAAKAYVRQTMIGKLVQFSLVQKAGTREFGDIKTPLFDSLVHQLLLLGLAKVKDSVPDLDEVDQLRQIEEEAKRNKVGEWDVSHAGVEEVPLNENVATKLRLFPISVTVEKVICGDRLVIRAIVDDHHHVVTPVLLAGIKCPRTDDPAHAKIGQLAKLFVEDKLMTTTANITAKFIGESQQGVPIAVLNHPSGNNIVQALLEQGFGEVVDWQLTLVGLTEMAKFRKAELTAKALAKGLYQTAAPVAAKAGSAAPSKTKLAVGATIDATVARVISPDTYVIRIGDDTEATVQLASVRGPRPNDSTAGASQPALVATAREFAREKVAGKPVKVYVDGHREANPDHGFDARFMVSINHNGNDLLEQLVSKGWATVLKHSKATSHERSLNWDKLVEVEAAATENKKGIHSANINKVLTMGGRVVDASENATKAKTFFNGFKQKGRILGFYVDYVPLANRVRLLNPKEGTKLMVILGGLTNDKLQIDNDEAVKFLNKKFLQRNVEFDVYDTDKVGGFIGNLYASAQATSPVQIQLVENGLAKLHEFSVSSNKHADELEGAETSAKAGKKGVWANYDAAAEKAQLEQTQKSVAEMSLAAKTPKFFDIEVVDIDSTGVISYHHLDGATTGKFAQFKQDFNLFHAKHPSSLANSVDVPFQLTKPPKKGDLVSAKFENGKFYRAKVTNFDRATNKFSVKHIDFGNVDEVPLSALRGVPSQFSTQAYPAFAHTCILGQVDLPPTTPTDYLKEAIEVLEDLCFDKKLVLGGLPSLGGVEYVATLYDSEKLIKDPLYTINKQLVAEGYAIVSKGCNDSELLAAQAEAKREHFGCWEFGDATAEADDF